jgi:hypothetical protein
MGRRDLYDELVRPRLGEITEWIGVTDEATIAKKLGISPRTFGTYKKDHAELKAALKKGRDALVEDLKISLKQKAKGFSYTEKKTTERQENGKKVTVVETFERYSPPDTGAIHLLLKNLDPKWRNDDRETMDLKREKIDLERKKAEAEDWEGETIP